jgi:hypothetical protein
VSALFVIVDSAAVEESRKIVSPPPLLATIPASFVIVAELALAKLENLNRPPDAACIRPPLLVRATFRPAMELLVNSIAPKAAPLLDTATRFWVRPDWFEMPVPLIVRILPVVVTVKAFAVEAKSISLTSVFAESERFVIVDVSKVAASDVPFGTVLEGFQLAGVFQSPLDGELDHCALAALSAGRMMTDKKNVNSCNATLLLEIILIINRRFGGDAGLSRVGIYT